MDQNEDTTTQALRERR
ncbi:hypothetical protein FOXB_17675 [Fusarium oxysporum f. sp. conglutinans Fo5176]|uniref:Uncharacterized protein n=1 Tax=Fusarium oxysporum (strain Fo5176) TaxID=660025 RepID=F9GG91_FUSOF|nr:hypothetical protein FOXB_17675 [Fusarium oxysporum f. sp. conglutinans Fo5176]